VIVRTNASKSTGIILPENSEACMSTPLAHNIPEACSLACTGRTSLYEEIKKGKLRAIKRGRRTLILDEDLRRWLGTLPPLIVKSPNCECE
jgi:excisionase family DNA binding protein